MITYAMVRIDTDTRENKDEIVERIDKMENEISCLTMIDVIQTVALTEERAAEVGYPTIYFP